MNILIIGESYSPNLGDPIICESVEYILKKKYSNITTTFMDLSGRQDFPNENLISENNIQNSSYFKRNLSKKMTSFGIDTEYIRFKRNYIKNEDYYLNFFKNNSYDLAIFAGGQLFLDYFVFSINKIVEILNEENTPVIFNACGYGTITSNKMEDMLSKALNKENVISISSRDDVSSINKLINSSSIVATKTFDPGILSSEVYNISQNKMDVIGLGIMWTADMDYRDSIEFWKNIITELEIQNQKWKIFGNGTTLDYELAVMVLKEIGISEDKFKQYLEPRPTRPKELVNTISKFKAIISFRLHSHIVAFSLSVPAVGVVWDNKVKFFYEGIELEDRCFNFNTEKKTAVKIVNKLNQAVTEVTNTNLIRKEQSDFLIRDLINNVNSTIN